MLYFRSFLVIVTALLGLAIIVPVADAGAVIKGSYIVTLKPDTKDADVQSHLTWVKDVHKRSLAKRDGSSKGTKGVEKVYDSKSGFKGYAGTFDADTIKKIKKNPNVEIVEEDRVWKISYFRKGSEPQPDKRAEDSGKLLEKRAEVTQKGSTWGLGTVSHRTKGWKSYIYDTWAGYDTYAYVIDTGVRTTHSEFGGRAKAAWTYWKGNNADTDGHGTHVAGTIAGKTYGVAKKATIMAVKVFLGEESSTSIILQGLNWAVNDIINKDLTEWAVINMSLGGDYSAAFNRAVEIAAQKGVISVVASGNESQNSANCSPASAPNAITVGAIDPNWGVAYYSNWGKTVDILAPGTDVISAGIKSNTATDTLSGTSMACPHVSGLVLYAMSVDGIYGLADVTGYLKWIATAKKITGNLRGAPNLIANNGNWLQ